jgi:hypothetical protein
MPHGLTHTGLKNPAACPSQRHLSQPHSLDDLISRVRSFLLQRRAITYVARWCTVSNDWRALYDMVEFGCSLFFGLKEPHIRHLDAN